MRSHKQSCDPLQLWHFWNNQHSIKNSFSIYVKVDSCREYRLISRPVINEWPRHLHKPCHGIRITWKWHKWQSLAPHWQDKGDNIASSTTTKTTYTLPIGWQKMRSEKNKCMWNQGSNTAFTSTAVAVTAESKLSDLPQISTSSCSCTEPLGISIFMCRMSFLSSNQECQSTEENSKHWH